MHVQRTNQSRRQRGIAIVSVSEFVTLMYRGRIGWASSKVITIN